MGEFFAGIDGGASSSTAVILDNNGTVLTTVHGPTTQLWLLGIEESSKRIINMIDEAKQKCGIKHETKITTLGVSISGGDQKEVNEKMIRHLELNFFNKIENFTVKSDTYGPVATACGPNGVVLIAGTGSNCQFISENGDSFRCGGWGHMIDDPGSAYWIAMKVIKKVFRHDDKYKVLSSDPTRVRKEMLSYFKVVKRGDMLDSFYGNFSKSFIAGFCKILAKLAQEKRDELCVQVFRSAGKSLANHILAIHRLRKINNNISKTQDLKLVCVGSVWKSWQLLREGFNETILESGELKDYEKLCLLQLTKTSAIGAAIFGAKSIGKHLNYNLTENFKTLYELRL